MPTSLQDILRRRQQEEFVGREEQLAFFQANLNLAPEDPRRRFIINVSGQGGVGKTWLLRRFRKIAEEAGAITACTDETENDVPGVMGRIAEQFEVQGHPLKTFAERYKVYRQRQQEIEADPEAPQGFPAFLGRTLAKGGLRLARRVPIGGVAADFVDEDVFASLAGDFASYVTRKIGNKDEVRLVLEPVEVLTPLFLADWQKVAKQYPLALFFDTYERTGSFLDPWLRDILEGRHGDVPVNILLFIAGRDTLDHNLWAPYEALLARLSVNPFTDEEAREYLARKGVTDEQVIEVIQGLSGRLPLLVATLAAENPDDPAKVGDPSGEAVERFLKWVEDPKQRQVALDAALPRLLNRDLLTVLAGEEQAGPLFAWLRGMPFVEKRGDGWVYHDVVRAQMLRYKRQESPRGWANLHDLLVVHYEELRDGLGLEKGTGRKDETWQRYSLEGTYHRLCHAPKKQLVAALNGFLAALRAEGSFAQRWAEVIEQAGEDGQSPQVRDWGERLLTGMKAREEDRHEEVSEMYTDLVEYPALERIWRAEALARRGGTHLQMERYEEALADFDRAIELDPDDALAIVLRGETYRLMERYEEALADFDRAIDLDPNDALAIVLRGETYRQMERYEEALADFDRAIALDIDDARAIALKGLTYRLMEAYEQALADFDRAIELNHDSAWTIVLRGDTYRQMERYEEALANFDRAIELDPDYAWAIFSRGETYQQMERYEEALTDFDRAIDLDPDDALAIVLRGETYRLMERYEQALADFDRAIELEPGDDWYLYERALIHQIRDQINLAREDLTVAIRRASETYEKEPQNWQNIFNLALYSLAAGRDEVAERLYREPLADGTTSGHIRGALHDLDDFLALFPDHPQAHAMRNLLQEHLEEPNDEPL